MRVHPVSWQPGASRSQRAASAAGVVRPAGRFGFHFLEMCAVMCIGGGLGVGLFFGAASLLGSPDLATDAPVWSALVASLILAAVMVAWMRFRRMDWRPAWEMAASSVAAAAVLIVGYGVDIVSAAALVPSVCLLACVAMIVVMLFRIPLYTSSHAGHHQAG
ncbi:hypothetical protein [Nocardioides mesophilus]|uniref:Uncharacterized protein n=1 Tax=Nocardioides mesophilus TaxID=433659 RepID=A0A7G9R8B9_9ACTN|nr:hypothetical protein [Nocardioides mesophilus]QNN51844.1 hypothetical protein H9L09_15040 [Nocardioides mesophilus]